MPANAPNAAVTSGVHSGRAPLAERATRIFNAVRDRTAAGQPVKAGETTALLSKQVRFDVVPVGWILDDNIDPMGQWFRHYGVGRPRLEPPSVLQVVWCDVNGHFPDDPRCHIDWAALAQSGTTLVLLMGVRQLPAIAAALAEGGLRADTPAAVVTKAASPAMQVVRGTLATIADLAVSNSVRPPSVTVIGDVAALDLR